MNGIFLISSFFSTFIKIHRKKTPVAMFKKNLHHVSNDEGGDDDGVITDSQRLEKNRQTSNCLLYT